MKRDRSGDEQPQTLECTLAEHQQNEHRTPEEPFMDKPRMSIDEFMDKFPPEKKRESILTEYRKEISVLKRKGYTIAQIGTFFELVAGQKVSRSSIIRFTRKKPKPDPSTKHEPAKNDTNGVPRPDKQQARNDTPHAPPPEPPSNLPRSAKKQAMENLAAKYDT